MLQLECLEKAVALKKEYPKMDIVIMVDNSEIAAGADWTLHKIREVGIYYFYSNDEVILTEYDEIMDYFTEDLELSEAEAEEKFKKEVKRVIAIRTEAMNIPGGV